MPNYSLVLDTKFKPFSYQEMLAPVMAATQAHQELEAEYGDLATKASVWERMANEQTDPYAYKMNKTYSEDLESMAEQLARSGLNPASRRNMLNMKSRYSSEILPIETAYKRREELAAEQRKAIAANPTLRYQRMAGQMSLDDFIRNPSLDYGESYSGALLTQQVSQAVANLQRALTDKGQLQKLGLPYQYERMLQYGATPSQVLAAMAEQAQNEPETATFLRGIVDQVMQSSGVADWADPETLREFRAFANQGLYSAIGQAKLDNFTDQFSMQDALNARQHARQVAAPRAAEERARQERLRMYDIDPTPLYGTSETAEQNRATIEELDRWKNKGYVDSRGQLTNKGWNAIKNQLLYDVSGAANSDSPYVRGRSYAGRDRDFMNWATEHGVQYTAPTKVSNLNAQGRTYYTYTEPKLTGYGNMTNYYNSTRQRAANGELVTGTPNIDVYRQSIRGKTDQDYILQKVTAALAGGNIYEVGSITESNGRVSMGRGRGMSSDEFERLATDNPILHIINSPTTNNQLIELSNGQKFIMPRGMLGNISQGNISAANTRIINAASDIERAVNLNQANTYLGSLLNYNEGTGIATNEGYIEFPINR